MSATFADYSRIRLLWPDHLGLARGKYVPGHLAHKGSGFCATTFAMSYDRDLIPAPHGYLTEGLRDVHGMPDPTTLRPSWEDAHTGIAVADLTLDHVPYAASSRAALQRAIGAWGDLGYTPMLGIELEGYLLERNDDGAWVRYSNPRSMVYGTGSLGDPSGFVDAIMLAAEQCDFTLESVNVEFDESQFEFTLQYDDALRAIDDAFVFRVLAREVAISMGLDFTFLGKPFPGSAGSGVHTNFSLLDSDEQTAMANADDPQGITALTRRCLAGLTTHHRALTAVSAPTVNAYRRLQPGELAGCWANWGVDHRNVSNRIPADGGAAMRIESRVGDGSMSLHLGAAAVLQAARLGVADELELPPAYEGDGFEDGGDGVERSATSLAEALDHLEADTSLFEAIGSDILDNFVANKRHEAERFAVAGEPLDSHELTQFEREQYCPYH